MSKTPKYIIGIDTGGTFTDAILLESKSEKVIRTAKVPTTHHQLSVGTGQALRALLQAGNIPTSEIETIAISSTLATNSVVENRGARVALFVIGYVKHFKLPVKAVIFVKGGHTITGAEEEPLELDYLVSLLESLKEEVDAFGVCSAMSFKNPTHELVTEKAISMIAPKPVFCSHRISAQAGMHERAATAGLHAKLMPVMKEYVAGVKDALDQENITSPVQVIGGNGKPISSDTAIEQAGMTVASGPACTAHFGSVHAHENALIIDVGGTTTDITMVKNSTPQLAKEGCQIGGWKTHVEAINMLTQGIGGDSHVALNDQKVVSIGPRRVLPIATSPCSLPAQQWLGSGEDSKCISQVVNNISDDLILQILANQGPSTIAGLRNKSGLGSMQMEKLLEKLSREQRIIETGFTPTDALHVLGEIEFGDNDKASKAAEILGTLCDMNPVHFAEMVVERTVELIENAVIEYITTHFWQKSLTNFISTCNNHSVLGVEFSLKIPIIGIGAAAGSFLPLVAKRLKTTVHFPENYQVGNAIGAAMICRDQINN